MTCKRGHDLSTVRVTTRTYALKDGTIKTADARRCNVCNAAAKRARNGGRPNWHQINAQQTHCPQGHRYAGPNLAHGERRWYSKRAKTWKATRYRICKACRVGFWMDVKARQLGLEARL